MALTTLRKILTRQAEGKAVFLPIITAQTTAATAATVNCGSISVQINANNMGTTFPSTLAGFALPASGLPAMTSLHFQGATGSARQWWLGRFYTIGTVNLAASPVAVDCFTHNAATFPVTRKQFNTASAAVPLIPILYITTTTATSAPVFILKTTAGSVGYKNQDGTGVVGTKSITLPSSATAQQSGFILPLETGDYAVTDILQVSLTTRGTAGAGTIYGFEPMLPLQNGAASLGAADALFSGTWQSLEPAVATSGSAASFLGVLLMTSATQFLRAYFTGVVD